MKITEVGWIPKDWEVSTIGDECDVKTGPFGSALHADDYVIKGTPIITVEHIGNVHIDKSRPIPQVSDEDKQRLKAYILKEGDIVFSRVGSIDRNSLVFKEEDGWLFSGRLLRMRKLSKAKFDPLYLCYHLNTYDSKNRILAEAVGQTMPSLNTKILNGISIVLPQSPSEQRRIAQVLSDTDSLIASLSRTIEKKRLVKQGAMQQLLTGKTRLKGFSGEWAEKKLGDIADIRTGKRNGDENVIGGLYPFFVRSQEVLRINSYSYEGEAIIVPGEGGIGKIFHYVHGKFDYHQRVYKVSDFPSDICTKYVYYYMTQFFGDYALNQTAKATVDSLRLPTFQEFEISIPDSWNEQFAIANILTTMDNEIVSLEAELQKYKALKQGMMQKLLTGQIRLK